MFIPKIGDEVTIRTDMYKGIGKVFYIDQANLYNSHIGAIQVEMDEPYDLYSEHTMLRVSLKEVFEPFKLIVAGGREFGDYKLLKTKMNALLKNKNKNEVVIVSGTARGADTLGEKYAIENDLIIKRFPADWSIGKQAGYIRNAEMAEYATACLLFWDGTSAGTGHMKDLAEKAGLQLRVINY